MKIIDVEQNSLAWLAARSGLVTASEVDALVSPLWKIRDSKGVDTYLAQKLAEKWVGGAVDGAMTLDMEFGKILESEAIPAYEFEFSESIQRVGLLTDDEGKIGCSPDGLIGDEGGIEIKCPKAATHIKYLLAGEVPSEYVAQIQFALFVTGKKWWKFMSYRRAMPMLLKTVEPEQKAQEAFSKVIPEFLSRLDKEWTRLCEMNGGPPAPNPFKQAVERQDDGEIIP